MCSSPDGGGQEIKPTSYGYGELSRVITQREFEAKLTNGDEEMATSSVVMIQCVGSRDDDHPYCSRICCSQAIKNALELKRRSPQSEVVILYRDIRTYGFRESFYTEARRKGVVFLRHEDDRKPKVARDGGGLVVTVYDPQLKRNIAIDAGLVVLSADVLACKCIDKA